MPDVDVRARAAQATVRLPGAQGILVPGNLIVTAAHCINWTTSGAMAHTNDQLVAVATDHAKFLACVVALEPCADIAVLGAPDGQALPDDEERFEAFCEQTAPIPLYTDDLPLDVAARPIALLSKAQWRRIGHSVKIHASVRTHNKGWVDARVRQLRPDATVLIIEPEASIDGGTSGGPVIADDGRLLGVVTWGGGRDGHGIPLSRLHRTVPVWLVDQMLRRGKG